METNRENGRFASRKTPRTYDSITNGHSTSIRETHTDRDIQQANNWSDNDRGSEIVVHETETYHRRWYMLTVFFINGFVQTWVLNTFSPIAEALLLIGWRLDYVAWMQVVWCITATIGAPLCVWIMDRKGLRLAMVLSTLCLVIGCAIRCFTSQAPAFAILTIIGFAIMGIGGAVTMSAGTVLSAVWFPPRQRAFATAVCVESTNLGVAASLLIGPAVVSSHVPAPTTVTPNTTTTAYDDGSDATSATNSTDALDQAVRSDVMMMMYIQCGIAVLLLVLVLGYFPNKPPKPPSISAACGREEFIKGMMGAFRCWKLWLLFIPFGTGCSIYYCWTSVYDVILEPDGLTETQSGWLAFYGTMSGITSAILVSVFAGVFIRYIKKVVLFMLLIATAAATIFTCVALGYMSFSIVLLYVSALVSGAVLYAIVPLCFELACEVVYPVSENIVCLMLQWWGNLFVIFFYVLFLIPSPHRTWMNWVVLGCSALSFISFLFLPEFYARLSVDEDSNGEREDGIYQKQCATNGVTKSPLVNKAFCDKPY